MSAAVATLTQTATRARTDTVSAENPGALSASSAPDAKMGNGSANSIQLVAPRPPITWRNFHTEIRWFNLGVVTLTPLAALYGLCTTEIRTPTVWFSVFLWAYNMVGAS